jgi:GNAT superfamily N-acetyltransferase
MTTPMQDLALTLETDPVPADVAALAAGLTEHSLPFTGAQGFLPIAVFARDAAGRLVGGVQGQINWNWLHVALFWVSAERRHGGLGSELLRMIEQAGADRGCRWVHLDTFSYQARPFYERQGYEVFATLDDYPPGHRRYYLKKRLA